MLLLGACLLDVTPIAIDVVKTFSMPALVVERSLLYSVNANVVKGLEDTLLQSSRLSMAMC